MVVKIDAASSSIIYAALSKVILDSVVRIRI